MSQYVMSQYVNVTVAAWACQCSVPRRSITVTCHVHTIRQYTDNTHTWTIQRIRCCDACFLWCMWLHVAGKRLTRICHSPSFMSLQWKRATSLCSCQRHCWACLSSTRRKLFACWEVRMGATPSTQPCLRSSVMTSPFWRSFLCHFGEMFASWYVDYTCYIYHIIYI